MQIYTVGAFEKSGGKLPGQQQKDSNLPWCIKFHQNCVLAFHESIKVGVSENKHSVFFFHLCVIFIIILLLIVVVITVLSGLLILFII